MKKSNLKIYFSLLLMALLAMPSFAQWSGVKGNGHVVRQNRDVRSFDGISVGGSFDVFVRQGRSESLMVEADENLLDEIITEVHNGTLKISTRKGIRNAEKLNIYITMEDLRSLHVSGAADLIAEGRIYSEDLEIHSSGSADIKLMDLRADNLYCSSSGSSDIRMAGRAISLTASMSGSSDLKASELEAEDCELKLSGSSDARVYASRSIDARASGSSDVYCYGNPGRKSISNSGSADIHFP